MEVERLAREPEGVFAKGVFFAFDLGAGAW